MLRGTGGVGRAATIEDVPAVTACLASAFHEDPLWGHWTFPEAESRAARLTHPHDRPHYYLGWWATHRDHAGRGLGAVLIDDNLAAIDAEHMPAYLESTNPANLPRYEALGFEPRREFGPPDGPVITTMWRDAR